MIRFEIISAVLLVVALNANGADLVAKDWWQKAGFYQIYPRSFKDSDGDGIGDLNGITSKLPYLKEIGVRAFWMSPINKSPMVDFGYDISDYRAIQPEYGTMENFENLVAEAKRLGLKVIMDFVPNHSSNKHEWFIKSEQRVSGYEDYYIWHAGLPNPAGGQNLPPSNWLQVFRGSAWEWSEIRQEYYLHQFTVEQPDLNYRNPNVVEEMKDVIRFWLDKGIDGFRVDAVPFLFEVTKNNDGVYPDEPTSGLTQDKEDFTYLVHNYTQNLQETLDMVYQWRELVDQYQRDNGGDTRVLMTEGFTSLEILKEYYVSPDGRLGPHMPFNFGFITDLNMESTADNFIDTIMSWMEIVPKDGVANWVIGNHDRPRVGTRFGEERIDALNLILLSLPGATVTYQGEEIGMTDVYISWEDTVDPAACNAGKDLFEKTSRDPCRTPFQWDDTDMAGFTDGNKTWLPVAPNYEKVNVRLQEKSTRSHLKVYKAMTKLRAGKTFLHGLWRLRAVNNVLIIIRELEGYNTYMTFANLGNDIELIDATGFGKKLPARMRYEVLGLSSHHVRGGVVATDDILLLPNESFVLNARIAPVDHVRESVCEAWLE